jgi:DNA repair photolyase
MKVTKARRTRLVTDTGFGAYDVCLNPYVGCQFGCKYCYVRFFVKDSDEPWGGFVRLRSYIADKLPKEIDRLAGQRLVLGTMTDPYQPQEKKLRLTRKVLEIIKEKGNPCKDIGLFTRSPMVLDDLDLLKELNVRIHLTITPFEKHILKKIEPIPVTTEKRFSVLYKLVKAGVKCHVSISPVLPILSEKLTESFAARIANIKPNGFTIDPMQCYGEAMTAMRQVLWGNEEWERCVEILQDKKAYKKWKQEYRENWREAWKPHKWMKILAIIMDHQAKTRESLLSGKNLDFQEFSYDQRGE